MKVKGLSFIATVAFTIKSKSNNFAMISLYWYKQIWCKKNWTSHEYTKDVEIWNERKKSFTFAFNFKNFHMMMFVRVHVDWDKETINISISVLFIHPTMMIHLSHIIYKCVFVCDHIEMQMCKQKGTTFNKRVGKCWKIFKRESRKWMVSSYLTVNARAALTLHITTFTKLIIACFE